MNFDETLAKSRELDRFLEKTRSDLMPITDGEPIFSIGDLVADIKTAKNELRDAVHKELRGFAADIRANKELVVDKLRTERRSVRDELGPLVGNEIVDTSDIKSDGA